MVEKGAITVSEAAGILGVTRQRVLQYIDEGKLPAQRIGPIYVVRRADLEPLKHVKRGRPRKPASELKYPRRIRPKKGKKS